MAGRAHVDASRKRLYWVDPEPGAGLPYDRPLSGFDLHRPLHVAELTYTVIVRRRGRPVGHFSGLSLIPEHPRFGPLLLPEPRYRFTVERARRQPDSERRLTAAPTPITIRISETVAPTGQIPIPLDTREGISLPLMGGVDGLAALRVGDFLGESVDPRDSDHVKTRKTRGIQTLNLVDEISIVAVPDILIRPVKEPEYSQVIRPVPDPCVTCPPPPEPLAYPNQPGQRHEAPPVFSDDEIFQVQAALVQHCEERQDRFALLDPPLSVAKDNALGVGALQAWRARFDTDYAALYYPWLLVVDPLGVELVRSIPACGHVAGQYSHHDLEIGVHKAPANQLLEWIQDVTKAVSFAEHGVLNPMGVNVVRAEAGRGVRIMGARTMSSDPDWRYINVRRLMIMIRKAIYLATQWVAFEPNHHVTRTKIRLSLSGFMTVLWQKGALAGAVPEAAFFVKCDEENNPPSERANGRLLAEVGVAPSKPFEFVVLRIGREGNSLEIREASDLARAA